MNESKLLKIWQIMIKENRTYTYICDECEKEIDSNQFEDVVVVDLDSNSEIAHKSIINIRTYMAYRGDSKDICYKCKLKILKRAINKLEGLIKEK